MKVAFIGAGYMAREHALVFQDISDCKISGVFSRTVSKSVKFAKNLKIKKIFHSIEELWEKTHSEIVVIAVNELSLNSVCKQAFRFPWLCLVEKPLGYNFHDAENILGFARKTKARVFVALNRRHYESTRFVLSKLKHIRGPRLIQVFDQQDQRLAIKAGKHKLVVDNWMFANSIHLVDYFRLFCRGELRKINRVIPWTPQDPRYVFVRLEYSSGDIGIYQAVWNAPGPWAASVTTQAHRFEIKPLEQAFEMKYGSRKANVHPQSTWDKKFKPGLRMQAEEAFRAARGLPHKLPDIYEGFESIKLIKKVYNL